MGQEGGARALQLDASVSAARAQPMSAKTDISELFEREVAAIQNRMINCESLLYAKRRDAANGAEREDFDRRVAIILAELDNLPLRLVQIRDALATATPKGATKRAPSRAESTEQKPLSSAAFC
jgi:hypothetical protein